MWLVLLVLAIRADQLTIRCPAFQAPQNLFSARNDFKPSTRKRIRNIDFVQGLHGLYHVFVDQV
jgi:hypothetical protein